MLALSSLQTAAVMSQLSIRTCSWLQLFVLFINLISQILCLLSFYPCYFFGYISLSRRHYESPYLVDYRLHPSHLYGLFSTIQKHSKNSSNFIVQVFETPQALTNVSEMAVEQLLLLPTRLKIDICPETKQLYAWMYLISIS